MANPLLIADCPRCAAKGMTFDVKSHVFLRTEGGWQNWHEVFSVCRNCRKPSIFLINISVQGLHDHSRVCDSLAAKPSNIMTLEVTLNTVFEVDRYIGLRDIVSIAPPEHLPPNIESAFNEAASCYSIDCHNASATMFRLCLDFASKPLLPDPNDKSVPQPNNNQRFKLGARLTWLFDQGILPAALKGLASCIREDGNDGAHAGTLTKAEADDILDFTTALLERLYTEPKKLELAELRRAQRRQPPAPT